MSLWERKKRADFLEFDREIRHPVRKMIVDRAVGETVLDVGCATCIDYPLWRDAGFRYTGVDFTKKFVDRAKMLYPDVDARVADALDLPFEDGSYDLVYAKDLIEHIYPGGMWKAMGEMWRVAGMKMMVAFFKAPVVGASVYRRNHLGFWLNRLDKVELLDFLRGLEGQVRVAWEEDVGYSKTALYEVERG